MVSYEQVENIQRFLNDFPGAETIRLEQNYRSTSNILSAANALIENNNGRLGKKLWTDGADGEPISLYCAFNELDEARFVVNRIKTWQDNGETWQRSFGYNVFYDEVFRIGTKMNEKDFPFKVGNEEYALWMWKGNYWNLHSGAEIGLYKYDRTHAGTKHYDAIDFEVPMRLSLYRYSNNGPSSWCRGSGSGSPPAAHCPSGCRAQSGSWAVVSGGTARLSQLYCFLA